MRERIIYLREQAPEKLVGGRHGSPELMSRRKCFVFPTECGGKSGWQGCQLASGIGVLVGHGKENPREFMFDDLSSLGKLGGEITS